MIIETLIFIGLGMVIGFGIVAVMIWVMLGTDLMGR